jgi:hypothetical protein
VNRATGGAPGVRVDEKMRGMGVNDTVGQEMKETEVNIR